MNATEQQKIARRLTEACDHAGNAAPAVQRELLRDSLARASRPCLLDVLHDGI